MGSKGGAIDLDVNHNNWNMLEGVRWVFMLFGQKGTSTEQCYTHNVVDNDEGRSEGVSVVGGVYHLDGRVSVLGTLQEPADDDDSQLRNSNKTPKQGSRGYNTSQRKDARWYQISLQQTKGWV